MNRKSTISKWLENSLNADETNEKVFISQLDQALQQKKAPELDIEKALMDFHATKNSLPAQKLIPLYKQPMFRYAATLALLLVSFLVWDPLGLLSSKTKIATQSGEELIHYLPDSSFVRINSASVLTYQGNEWPHNRTIYLEGEAFFKVQKGSTFTVTSTQGTVEVLGTEFNIRDRKGIFEVECYEGKVHVTTEQTSIEKDLLPGDKIQLIDNQLTTIQSNLPGTIRPSWTEQRMSFQSVPLSIVLKEVERQYNVKIITQNLNQDQKFTGSFSENNLTIALKTITESLRLRYTIIDKQKVQIYSEAP